MRTCCPRKLGVESRVVGVVEVFRPGAEPGFSKGQIAEAFLLWSQSHPQFPGNGCPRGRWKELLFPEFAGYARGGDVLSCKAIARYFTKLPGVTSPAQ